MKTESQASPGLHHGPSGPAGDDRRAPMLAPAPS